MNLKTNLAIFCALIFTLFGQLTQGQNISYVRQDIIKTSNVTTDSQIGALTQGNIQTTRVYIDGMGRAIQTIVQQASPAGKDIIRPMAYDNLGRQTASYLPYADEGTSYATGAYRPNAVTTDQASFYNQTNQYLVKTDAAPYNQAVFENSPLQRLLSEGMTGVGYQPTGAPLSGGSGTQYFKTASYRSNTAGDGNILVWNPDGSYTSGNYYATGSLSVTEGKDEAGSETLVFTDFAGHTILKRQIMGSSNADTYYIYNNAGMLSYIVPPAAVALMQASGNYNANQSGAASTLIFQFVYDNMGRLTQKIVPSKGTMSIVYDPLNRPVLIQDANLALLKEWNYIRYDVKGRPISQGIYTNTTTLGFTAMQSYVNGLSASYQTAWYESRNTVLSTGYYTATIFPTTATGTITPLAYAYFDNYTLTSGVSYSYLTRGLTGEETATTAPVKGMPTMVRIAPVGPAIATAYVLLKVTFYDKRLHPIQVQSNNELNFIGNTVVTDYSTTAPDFIGVPQVTQVSKTIASGTTTVQTRYVYDGMDRVLNVSQTYNGGTSQQVASYTYNELGQLIKKGLGYVGSTTNPLQNVDYRFNIRGQLLSINNSTLAYDNGVTNSDYNDLFGMTFLYDQADGTLSNTLYHNGDLSEAKWMSLNSSGTASNERSFTYSYDQLNRYTSSAYAERMSGQSGFIANVGEYSEAITYNTDNSGNIHYLTRGTSAAYVDNLTYTYSTTSPNQLNTVTDAGNTSQGFYNLTGSTTPYVYDVNGNLTNDYYKGISINYNYLNRTNKITVTTGTNEWLDYTYDAGGNVIRKRQYNNNTLQTTTDYIDGFVYITAGTGSAALSYFPMPEGRVMDNSGTFTQEFIITDQQGNARVSFNNTGAGGTAKVVQENSYYGTGLTIQPIVAGDNNKKLYNGGAEWQNDFSNLPDYYQTFYRNYDPSIARFIGVDPEAESAESMTTYNYAGNNPLMNNDPMGNASETITWDMIHRGTPGPGQSAAALDALGFSSSAASSDYMYSNDDLLAAAQAGDPYALQMYGKMYGTTVYQAGESTSSITGFFNYHPYGGPQVSEDQWLKAGGNINDYNNAAAKGSVELYAGTFTFDYNALNDAVDNANQGGPNALWGKMYVISYVENPDNPGLTDGHAWIRLESASGTATTMSLWGNQGDQEFWVNKELNFGYGTVSKSVNITNAQYSMIGQFNSVPGNVDWTYLYTCAGYSAAIWNYVTGDSLSASDAMGITTTPRALIQSIQASPNAIVTPKPSSIDSSN